MFDLADRHELANKKGDLFGVLPAAEGSLRAIGTRGEQVAEFPVTSPDQPWHGYPIWAIKKSAREGRPGTPIPREALDRMVEVGLLTISQQRRLRGGKPI